MAKLPKKPKMSRMPKKPKATASLAVWEKHEQKCKDVVKNNKAKVTAWTKECAAIKSAAKKKESIMAGIGKIK